MSNDTLHDRVSGGINIGILDIRPYPLKDEVSNDVVFGAVYPGVEPFFAWGLSLALACLYEYIFAH